MKTKAKKILAREHRIFQKKSIHQSISQSIKLMNSLNFECWNQASELPNTTFEAAWSRGSWVMIEHTNKQKIIPKCGCLTYSQEPTKKQEIAIGMQVKQSKKGVKVN